MRYCNGLQRELFCECTQRKRAGSACAIERIRFDLGQGLTIFPKGTDVMSGLLYVYFSPLIRFLSLQDAC